MEVAEWLRCQVLMGRAVAGFHEGQAQAQGQYDAGHQAAGRVRRTQAVVQAVRPTAARLIASCKCRGQSQPSTPVVRI